MMQSLRRSYCSAHPIPSGGESMIVGSGKHGSRTCRQVFACVLLAGFVYLGHAPAAYSQVPSSTSSSDTAVASVLAQRASDEASNRRHWQTVLKLISRPNPDISVDDFKDNFWPWVVSPASMVSNGVGAEFYSTDDATLYEITAEAPRKPAIDGFSFSFALCYPADQAFSDLEKAGWTLGTNRITGPFPHWQPDFRPLGRANTWSMYGFLKGNHSIALLSLARFGCVISIDVQDDPSQFDKIRQQLASSLPTNPIGPNSASLDAPNNNRWKIVLKLIGREDSTISLEDFKANFRPYVFERPMDINGETFQTISSDDVTFDESSKDSHPNQVNTQVWFSFDHCYDIGLVVNDLREAGWTFSMDKPPGPWGTTNDLPILEPLGRYIFLKGNRGVATVFYSPRFGCTRGVSVQANQSQSQDINHQPD